MRINIHSFIHQRKEVSSIESNWVNSRFVQQEAQVIYI